MADSPDVSSYSADSCLSFGQGADSRFDAESLFGPEGSSTDAFPKDYWFGQKYFECILAEGLLRDTLASEPASRVDSKFAEALRKYPFDKCVAYLRSKGVVELNNLDEIGGSHREALLSQIGVIFRQTSTKRKRLLRHAIRRFVHRDDTGPRDNIGPRNEIPVSKISDAPKFTSMLKEHGDHIGVVPEYTEKMLNFEPALYRVRVTFKNITGEGTARTKKEARHLASKEACQRLGLNYN